MPGRASVPRSSVAMGESGPVMVLSGEADTHAAAQLRELLVAQLFRGRRRLGDETGTAGFLGSSDTTTA